MSLWNVVLPMSIEAEDAEDAIDVFVTSLAREDQYAYTYRLENAETGEVFYWIAGEALPRDADVIQSLLAQFADEDENDG